MEMTAGERRTPIAFTDSQNIPSAALAFPIVPQATSFPFLLNEFMSLSTSMER